MGHGAWGIGEMGETREQGKRLKVKGKRNKFNLSPFAFTPFPFPMPCLRNLQCKIQNLKSKILYGFYFFL
jgi:hypothetical protein